MSFKQLFQNRICCHQIRYVWIAAWSSNNLGNNIIKKTMDRREDALKEALQTNIEETQRWQTYLKDNENAIENLDMFGKRLTVDVMVPLGKKAYMPGHLLHTNEVLVAHYQGYFSKCTSFKAKEICEFRIKMAKEHLEKLETESELWQNKLDKPYAEGVMPSGDEREIIEDYNDENEKLWKEQHKIRVKQAKQKEREAREKEIQQHRENSNKNEQVKEKTEEDILKILEEAEIIEELEQELENLEADGVTTETIHKLMSGEMKLPEKKNRIGCDKVGKGDNKPERDYLTNTVKKKEICTSFNVPATNNNVLPNPELLSQYLNSNNEEEWNEEPLPEEVNIIKEQAKFLNTEDQIGFYEYQIEIIRQKIKILPLRTPEELNEKIKLLNVLEHVEELLELAEETVGAEELCETETKVDEIESKENQQKEETITSDNVEQTNAKQASLTKDQKTKSTQKRCISFALEDQTLEFRKNERVTQMLSPKSEKPPKRDIIKLTDDEDNCEKLIKIPSPTKDKKDLIQAKVNSNLEFVSENQSKQDFDLVQQILQSSTGQIKTLTIKFKHSTAECQPKDGKQISEIPLSPADFYELYNKSQESLKEKEPSILFIDSYEGEDKVKAPVLKEVDRQEAFINPKSEFSNPCLQVKSILKNQSEVDKENHQKDPQQQNVNKNNKKSKKKTARKPEDDDESLSAYNKVMNEVVEKPPLTEPDPLPNVKFIDAHAPKKRISRFKQMRQGTEKS